MRKCIEQNMMGQTSPHSSDLSPPHRTSRDVWGDNLRPVADTSLLGWVTQKNSETPFAMVTVVFLWPEKHGD
jgi:hypothetical protein